MTSITRDDVIRMFGPVDDIIAAEIVSAGATAEELAEAKAWLMNDEPLVNMGRPFPAGRIGHLVEIIRRIEDEEPGPAGHRV